MTDQPGVPAWPGAAPPAPQPPAGPRPEPRPPASAPAPQAPGPPDVVPPSAGRSHQGRNVDLKIVIAVLIGLVSVTGAVVTWQSAQLGEQATDKDRQAVAEAVRVAQDAANDEITVQDARSRVAAHAAALASAEVLEAQSERFDDAGNAAAARAAADEAQEQRAFADSYLFGGTTPFDLGRYVVVDPDSGLRVLAERQLRTDIGRQSDAQARVNPDQTVREANRLRDESQHFDGWLVPLVGAVVVLTLAQISRRRLLRLALAGGGTALWLVSTAFAFGGS